MTFGCPRIDFGKVGNYNYGNKQGMEKRKIYIRENNLKFIAYTLAKKQVICNVCTREMVQAYYFLFYPFFVSVVLIDVIPKSK